MTKGLINKRFRTFLPIVVDLETGGVNPETDALLEIAAIIITNDHQGYLKTDQTFHEHIVAHPDTLLHEASLKINKIKPDHPFRFAKTEHAVLTSFNQFIKQALKQNKCSKAILVGHNAHFDLNFINAACKRNQIKALALHRFSCLDTVSLAALAFKETILAKALYAANIAFDPEEAHSALYDAQKTAELFCRIINHYDKNKQSLS
jgi:ribonuclease T